MTSTWWTASAVWVCLMACGQMACGNNGERASQAGNRPTKTAGTPALALSPSSAAQDDRLAMRDPSSDEDPALPEGTGASAGVAADERGGSPGSISGDRAAEPPALASGDRAMASAPIAHVAGIDGDGDRGDIPGGTGGPGPGVQRPPPSVLTPLPELCKEACANAHRLVEAELAADTAKAMREEVERALERDCPGRCLQRASLESARCIAGAKSALELAACP
jgi:hypothetical protein